MSTKAKKNIETIVAKYKFSYPDDYATTVKAVEAMHHMIVDEFASAEGSPNIRGLYETPEELYAMFIIQLDEDDMKWFKTKNGGKWYAKKFKEFALPQNINWDR